jgi:hypothetical protein
MAMAIRFAVKEECSITKQEWRLLLGLSMDVSLSSRQEIPMS